jgi:hypothetical protein
VEKKNELVLEILRRLSRAGILDRILLIGSWAASFYKAYFSDPTYAPVLKTRDIDFLVAPRTKFGRSVDMPELLKDLGFDLEFSPSGYMRLESDELIIEMLSPEVGPSKDRPLPLPELKFNAQPLRHLSMLLRAPIDVKIDGIEMRLPHPADFALHKLVISEDRKNKDKKSKDLDSAYRIIEMILETGEQKSLKDSFASLTEKQKKRVKRLTEAQFPELF